MPWPPQTLWGPASALAHEDSQGPALEVKSLGSNLRKHPFQLVLENKPGLAIDKLTPILFQPMSSHSTIWQWVCPTIMEDSGPVGKSVVC